MKLKAYRPVHVVQMYHSGLTGKLYIMITLGLHEYIEPQKNKLLITAKSVN